MPAFLTTGSAIAWSRILMNWPAATIATERDMTMLAAHTVLRSC